MPLARQELSIEDMAMINHNDESGRSGTSIYAGQIIEDHVAEIRGKKWAEKVHDISRSDSNVAMCLSALKLPIKSANWYVSIDEDKLKKVERTPELEELISKQQRLIEKAFFEDCRTPFTRLLGEILSLYEQGYSLFEITHKINYADEEFGTYITLKDVAFRDQRSIESWNVDKHGNLLSVDQWTDGDIGTYARMPAEFLCHFAPDQLGDNYEGRSVVRPMYGNWMRKNAYLRWVAAGNEKSAIPTPKLKFTNTPDTNEKKAAKKLLENYTSGARNYLIHNSNTELETFTITFDPEKMMKCVAYEDQAMVNCILASFLLLGQGGNGGSLALGKDLSDFFTQTFNTTTDYICEVMQKRVIDTLILSNFSGVPCYVKLSCENMKDNANIDFANILRTLIDGKAITIDSNLESWVREKFQYPAKEETKESQMDNASLLSALKIIGEYYSSKISVEQASTMLKQLGFSDLEIFQNLNLKNPIPAPVNNPSPVKMEFSEAQKNFIKKEINLIRLVKENATSPYKWSEAPVDKTVEKALAVVDSNALAMTDSFQKNLNAIGLDYIKFLLNKLTSEGDDNLEATNQETQIDDGRVYYNNLMKFLMANATEDSINLLKEEPIKLSESIKFSEATFLARKDEINLLLGRINDLSESYELGQDYMETKSELNKLRQEFNELVQEHLEDTGHWTFKRALADLEAKAETQVSVQLNDLKKKLDLQYQASTPTASNSGQVLNDLVDSKNKYITGNDLAVGSDIISSQIVNDTRLQLTLDIPEVEGYVYDATIDSKTCPACLELNQYYFPKNDPNLGKYTPPLHPNSRAIWKIVYKGDSIDGYKTGSPSLSAKAEKAISI